MIDSTMVDGEQVPFRISAGLKRLIGRDLITNEFVAIFELVKNSFDAHADHVHLVFLPNRIIIIDDGKGMGRKALLDRWLFVAYSAKRDGTEDESQLPLLADPSLLPTDNGDDESTNAPNENYRSRVSARRAYAGNKGVGRFSCDRLGRRLTLQSRARGEKTVHQLKVDWDQFELDPKQDFVEIKVTLERLAAFDYDVSGEWPATLEAGTVLIIDNLRTDASRWDRKKLHKLKAGLAKLINPFEDSGEDFSVFIHAPDELEEDRDKSGLDVFDEETVDEGTYTRVVNGPVKNFVLGILKSKTTYVDVRMSQDGEIFESKLVDRGEIVYSIRESAKNYSLLKASGFQCQLFFLNRSAKKTFAHRMGLSSKDFGSIFLFNNGFRVYPIGEPQDDSFGLDSRKAQGWGRSLGTRDLIGRIDVFSSGDDFRESTSRDQGLIKTAAYGQLQQCFKELCLKRLERYVVDVTWADKEDKNRDTIDGLAGDEGSARVTELVSKLVKASDVDIMAASPNLIRLVDERAKDFGANIEAFRVVAGKLGDKNLLKRVRLAEERFAEVQRLEAEERAAREREEAARRLAETQVREAQAAAASAEKRAQQEAIARVQAEQTSAQLSSAYTEEKKRNLFLTSLSSIDEEALQDLLHLVGISATALTRIVTSKLSLLQSGRRVSTEEWLTFLERALILAQRVQVVSQVSTKAQFRLQSETVHDDLAGYVRQYCEEVCRLYSGDQITLEVEDRSGGFEHHFKPIEVGILLDNLVSNSRKARARSIHVDLEKRGDELILTVEDDGRGFADLIDKQRIFEKGFSTTNGSGLGLYHVKKTLDEMGGIIEIADSEKQGAKFVVRIRRPANSPLN